MFETLRRRIVAARGRRCVFSHFGSLTFSQFCANAVQSLRIPGQTNLSVINLEVALRIAVHDRSKRRNRRIWRFLERWISTVLRMNRDCEVMIVAHCHFTGHLKVDCSQYWLGIVELGCAKVDQLWCYLYPECGGYLLWIGQSPIVVFASATPYLSFA